MKVYVLLWCYWDSDNEFVEQFKGVFSSVRKATNAVNKKENLAVPLYKPGDTIPRYDIINGDNYCSWEIREVTVK